MSLISLFRGTTSEVDNRTRSDGQLLVDTQTRTVKVDVAQSGIINRITVSSSGGSNTQSDFAETDPTSSAYIKNKPVNTTDFVDPLFIYSDTEPTADLVNDKTRWCGGDNKVDLTFINMDGSTYRVIRRTPGEVFPTVPIPTLDNYRFDYWSPSLPSVVPNVDTTYTAIARDTVTLTFLGYDGTTYRTIQTYEGDPFPTIANPTHENARFLGWNPSLPSTVPSADATYSSTWEDAIELTFLGHGGTTLETIYGYVGEEFPTIEDPTYTDSRFLGWSPTLPNVIPNEDTVYTSTWLDKVTLTFLGHGGTTYRTETGFPGDAFPTITNPTYTNSRFLGWSPTLPSTIPSSSTTYSSTWLDAVTLTFKGYGGSTWKTTLAYPGDAFPNPGTPTATDKRFTGWSPSLPAKVPSSNTTYTSQWLSKVTMTFYNQNENNAWYTWKTLSGFPGDSYTNPGTPPKYVLWADSFTGWATTQAKGGLNGTPTALPSKIPSSNSGHWSCWSEFI